MLMLADSPMATVHDDGLCKIRYEETEMKLNCFECGIEYDENYLFFVMHCGCSCGDLFRVYEECSHMFYKCEIGGKN